MLKALELCGFKSFADKTRFEFPAGITVVVGPNGSGKSNIVDAMKWVLGEQSAKSLRGRDMADVIFKGSGGAGRKPMNTAEATLVFDNSDRRLGVDAPEVYVTRRVYRSGEGEYLINREPSRLRDIKDLFRGTGVGADAYSLIEQGKVDSLLQASPRDRRAIFEEAAGISRFKAKKIESQRRLERVAQNLLRLSDIVEEVESRLRSVRAQATKARRYKELSERLQQLRTQVGLTDWRALSAKLGGLEGELAQTRAEIAATQERSQVLQLQTAELEQDLLRVDAAWQEAGVNHAQNREQTAAAATAATHERDRIADLEQQVLHAREQFLVLTARASDGQERLGKLTELLGAAEAEHAEFARAQEQSAARRQSAGRKHDEATRDLEQRRSSYLQQMRTVAGLANQLTGAEAQVRESSALSEEWGRRADLLTRQAAELQASAETLRGQAARTESSLSETTSAVAQSEANIARLRQEVAQAERDQREARSRSQAAHDRLTLLSELEHTQAGLGPGSREVLERAQRGETQSLGRVRGLVAGLIESQLEFAPLIDAALGDAAQYIVVGQGDLIHFSAASAADLAGRIGLVEAGGGSAAGLIGGEHQPQLQQAKGVLGRADRFVRTEPEFAPLIRRLLGSTWIVETLEQARMLQGGLGRRCRFVTRAGDVLEVDGTLITGPRRQDAGLVARRSELKALAEQMADLERKAGEAQQSATARSQELSTAETLHRDAIANQQQAATRLVKERTEAQAASDRASQMQGELDRCRSEQDRAATRQATMTQQAGQFREGLSVAEGLLVGQESELAERERQLGQLHQERGEWEREATASQVRLARSEQRLEGLRQQVRQFEDDQAERDRALAKTEQEIEQAQHRGRTASLAILNLTSELARLALAKEQLAAEIVRREAERASLTASRAAGAAELEQQREAIHTLEETRHRLELAAGDVRHERSTLADRLREDYGIDLAAMGGTDAAAELARQEVETEIADLRRRLHHMGAVNLEALDELQTLEERFSALHSQYQDLVKSKEALERIIERINTDSRRLFSETLETIRTNFQQLFRRVFGGGKADIVLEEGVDMLDAGVEIIATPPGKQSLSISLLSGGEKALTAVTLLLAIFQFRPSPFCVLDEVDGPLDEANIGRFIDVLREFLSWTKFVIVTHSKKTMTAATTLYGVTMQESGISKRVSVRFEDVSENGAISRTALEREAQGKPAEGERGVA